MCVAELLVLWSVKIIIMTGLRRALRSFFKSFLWIVVGNWVLTLLILGLISRIGSLPHDPKARAFIGCLCFTMVLNNLLNIPTYFIAYLFEVTEQAALLLTEVADYNGDEDFRYDQQSKILLNNLVSLPAFHKNLFPLAFAKYCWIPCVGIIIYLFIYLYHHFYDSWLLMILQAAAAYFLLSAIVNHRMFMLALVSFATLTWTALYILFVVMVDLIFTIVFYAFFSIPLGIMMLAVFLSRSNQEEGEGNVN